MTGTSNYALRLPTSLKRELERLAREDRTSLNQFIVTAAAEKLATLKTADYFAERIARADVDAAREILRRPGGEPPRVGDEIPSGWASPFVAS